MEKIYGHLSPVATTVRTVQVMGQTALSMPWFQCPARSQSNLEAVKETLTDDFMGKGIRHDDVAWRNVGVYRQGGQTKAVVFDMQKVYCVEKHEKEDWVTPAVARLSKKLTKEGRHDCQTHTRNGEEYSDRRGRGGTGGSSLPLAAVSRPMEHAG